jgi:ubiquinone/menaquinone biosynthesis C-methylase UbiE
MKDYKRVVAERYEQAEHPRDARYHPLKPLGFHLGERQRRAVWEALREVERRGLDLSRAQILDLGCGTGVWSRFLAEVTRAPEKVTGVDLSSRSIEEARRLHAGMRYEVADVLTMPAPEVPFDLVYSAVVFSHMTTQAQLDAAMATVRRCLRPGGYFLWLDIWSPNHEQWVEGRDSHGFPLSQMEGLCRGAGLEPVWHAPLFKTFLGKYHSAYLLERVPPWAVRALDVLPWPPGNVLLLAQG